MGFFANLKARFSSAVTPTIYFADISHYQPVLGSAYNSPIIIIKASQGTFADSHLKANQVSARNNPHIEVIGYYCYLASDVSATTQADVFLNAIGPMRSNEFIVCDAEAGSGDQSGRVNAFLARVDSRHKDPRDDFVYSGLSFFGDHLRYLRPGVKRWVAAYRSTEPAGTHTFWQYSDHRYFAGVGYADASSYHGTVNSLLTMIGAAAPTSSPTTPTSPTSPTTPLPVPTKDKTMLFLIQDSTSQAVWVTNGVQRWHIPSPQAMADYQTLMKEAGLTTWHLRPVRDVTLFGAPVN